MKKNLFLFVLIFSSALSLQGCAKIWSPVFKAGKAVNPDYYSKYPYYNGNHQLCSYDGPHIHHPELGPISVPEKDEKTIRAKYRYPGMEDQFKDMDNRIF